jgi:hypothetical protein
MYQSVYKKRKLLRCVLPVHINAILLTCLFFSVSASGDAKSEIDQLTGGIHTRVAWREGGDQIKGGSKTINGFDSKTGKIHTIWSDGAVKSVLCSDGNKLLVTSGDYKVWVVDWDGSNKKQLAAGSVSDGWRDPATGKDWAIYRASGTGTGGGIHRVSIDDPTQKVEVYGGPEGHSVYPWFQISADGKSAASFFPYGTAGFLDIASGKVTTVSKGCWSGMASDNSGNWFHLTGSHKSLVAFNKTKKLGSFGIMPQNKGGQSYCPRAAEGPEKGGLFFTISGWYPGYNKNGPQVEVFVGKLNSGYNKVEGWARITNNNVPDHHPSVWIGVKEEGATSAAISLLPVKLSFTATEGASTVEPKTVTSSTKEGSLQNVTAESDQTWLKVTVKQSGDKWEIENKPDITGLSAKIHKATVTVKASNAPSSKTYEVELTVQGAAKLSKINISPPTLILMPGKTKTLTVEALDQFDKPISPKPTITFSADNSAKIDKDGTFTAPEKAGKYTVTAQAGDIKGTSRVTVMNLEITSKHKDKKYGVGDKVTVNWTASEDFTINFWISINSGRTWLLINKEAGIPTKDKKGTFSWKIPSELDEASLANSSAMFRVSNYWEEAINDRSDKFSIKSTGILVKGVSASFKPISMRMIGPRTLDLHITKRGPFQVDFMDTKGKIIEKFSGRGPLNIRWIGQTAGVYLVRLKSQHKEINKKVIVW